MAQPFTKADISQTLHERQQALTHAMSGLKKRGLVIKSFSVNVDTPNPELVLAFPPSAKQIPKGMRLLTDTIRGDARGVQTDHHAALFMGCRVRWQEERVR